MSIPTETYFIHHSWSTPTYEASASWLSTNQPKQKDKDYIEKKTLQAFKAYKLKPQNRQTILSGDRVEFEIQGTLVELEFKIPFRFSPISPERKSPFTIDLSPITGSPNPSLPD